MDMDRSIAPRTESKHTPRAASESKPLDLVYELEFLEKVEYLSLLGLAGGSSY